ncbi:MAG: RNA 2',3'-cyclic phosphodiesterase [Methanobacterium sp.]|nr:RNA 2',3'-cyclic phosphodiesterase [Methanobacterium sp.]
MRAFLAVDLDKELHGKVCEVQDSLKESNATVKFVEEENLHFTCKFFGDISENREKRISASINDTLTDYIPFEINIKGVGVFPHPGYVRVIWLGLENSHYFSQIIKNLDDKFSNLGFKKEKSYIPHLTIGRVKSAKNKDALVARIKELEDIEIGSMKVDKLVLKKSDLTPKGPVYSTIEEFKL